MQVWIPRRLVTPIDSKPAPPSLSDVIAYSGAYSVKSDHLIHHVQISTDANRSGKDLIRYYSFDGNLQILKTEVKAGTQGLIEWERIT